MPPPALNDNSPTTPKSSSLNGAPDSKTTLVYPSYKDVRPMSALSHSVHSDTIKIRKELDDANEKMKEKDQELESLKNALALAQKKSQIAEQSSNEQVTVLKMEVQLWKEKYELLQLSKTQEIASLNRALEAYQQRVGSFSSISDLRMPTDIEMEGQMRPIMAVQSADLLNELDTLKKTTAIKPVKSVTDRIQDLESKFTQFKMSVQ